MTQQIVECIPNFSEGRRPEVIASITDAISNVDGVSLLDQHSDEDHNRTVLTFSGPPRAVLEAADGAVQVPLGPDGVIDLARLDDMLASDPRPALLVTSGERRGAQRCSGGVHQCALRFQHTGVNLRCTGDQS